MHRNPIWLAFLLLFALLTAWYAGDALYKIYRYDTLSKSAKPSSLELEVVDNGSRFYYLATYTIKVNDQIYEGHEQLAQPIFRNEAAAKAFMKDYLNDPWIVSYSPKNPLKSTLQKSYPMKEAFYATAMVALLCYFLWLGFKVADQSQVGR